MAGKKKGYFLGGLFSSNEEDKKTMEQKQNAAEEIGKNIPIAGKAVSTVADRRRKEREMIAKELGLKKGGVVSNPYSRKLAMAKKAGKSKK